MYVTLHNLWFKTVNGFGHFSCFNINYKMGTFSSLSKFCLICFFVGFTEVMCITTDCSTYATRELCTLSKSGNGLSKCVWSTTHQDCRSKDQRPSDTTGGKRAFSWRQDISDIERLFNLDLTVNGLSKSDSAHRQAGSSFYDPRLAYTYVLMSAVAYSAKPKKCQSAIFPGSDFVLQQAIQSPCVDLPLFKYKQCYAVTAVSHKSKTILIAYRGTLVFPNPAQLVDEMISILFQGKVPFISGGKVQKYFKHAHDKLAPCVESSLKNLTKAFPGYNVTITGHSLGAALAAVSAASLIHKGLTKGNSTSVYAFGLPRIGDGDFALSYDKLVPNSWRVVHNRDVVAHLPTCNLFTGCTVASGGPYHTKTEVFYPDVPMNVSSPYKLCAKNEDYSCSDGLMKKDWCVKTGIDNCVKYHRTYFGITLGSICDKVMFDPDGGQGQGHFEYMDKQDTCQIMNL